MPKSVEERCSGVPALAVSADVVIGREMEYGNRTSPEPQSRRITHPTDRSRLSGDGEVTRSGRIGSQVGRPALLDTSPPSQMLRDTPPPQTGARVRAPRERPAGARPRHDKLTGATCKMGKGIWDHRNAVGVLMVS